RSRVDVREYRASTDVEDGIGGGSEGHGRRDRLVSRRQTRGRRRAVQGRGPRTERDGVTRAGPGGHIPLELRDAWARRQPVTAKRVRDGRDVPLVDPLAAVGEEILAGRLTSRGRELPPPHGHDA